MEFNIFGFLLGLFLGLIGVLLAYIFSGLDWAGDGIVGSAWTGLLVLLLIILLAFVF